MFLFACSADDLHDHLSTLAGGLDAVLSREDKDDFMDLQIVRHYENEVTNAFLDSRCVLLSYQFLSFHRRRLKHRGIARFTSVLS